jgi:hypothetical protein
LIQLGFSGGAYSKDALAFSDEQFNNALDLLFSEIVFIHLIGLTGYRRFSLAGALTYKSVGRSTT